MKVYLLLFFALFVVEVSPTQAEHRQQVPSTVSSSLDAQSPVARKPLKKRTANKSPLRIMANQEAVGVVLIVLAAIFTFPLLAAYVGATLGVLSAAGAVGLLFGSLLVGLLYWGGLVRIQRQNQPVSKRKRLLDTSVLFGSMSLSSLLSILIFALALDWVGIILMGIIGITTLAIWIKYALRPIAKMKEK